jgi:hypothetical protein
MWNLSAVGFIWLSSEITPDPVLPGIPGFTWDVELVPSGPGLVTWASSSLSKVFFGGDTLGGGTQFIQGVFSGVVEYRTQDFFGNVAVNAIGLDDDPDGVVPGFIDSYVTSVTFGWGVSTVSVGEITIHMEVWQES